MDQELKSKIVKLRDLIKIAENVPLDNYSEVYWSVDGLQWLYKESGHICLFILKEAGIVNYNHEVIYKALVDLRDYIEDIMMIIDSNKGKELLMLPLVQQSYFWKIKVYKNLSEILKAGFLNLKATE